MFVEFSGGAKKQGIKAPECGMVTTKPQSAARFLANLTHLTRLNLIRHLHAKGQLEVGLTPEIREYERKRKIRHVKHLEKMLTSIFIKHGII
jgi:hypothetical protein